jgi:hypothetical protein
MRIWADMHRMSLRVTLVGPYPRHPMRSDTMASKDQFNEKARQDRRKAQDDRSQNARPGRQPQQPRREQPPRESREQRPMRDREEGIEDQEPFEET